MKHTRISPFHEMKAWNGHRINAVKVFFKILKPLGSFISFIFISWPRHTYICSFTHTPTGRQRESHQNRTTRNGNIFLLCVSYFVFTLISASLNDVACSMATISRVVLQTKKLRN